MSDTLAPEIISDVPIPLLDSTSPNPSSTQSKSVTIPTSEGDAVPSTIPDKALSITPVASEVIGTSIDTQQRKILGAYTFGQVGALQIGKFNFGVSGQINISPDGIIAEDKQGVKYLTINDAGIAITDGTNATILDAFGIRSTTQFLNGSISNGSTYNTTSVGFVDIPDTTLSFTLGRTANVFIEYDVLGLENSGIGAGGNCRVQLLVDGVAQSKYLSTPGRLGPDGTVSYAMTSSASIIIALGAGAHTLSLQFQSQTGTAVFIKFASISYIVLGT